MSKCIKIGDIALGGNNEIIIQSMTNVNSSDYDALMLQVSSLFDAGCKIVRVAVSNDADIKTAKRVILNTNAVLCADIQFDYRLAIAAAEAGFRKIRINPGNIGGEANISKIVSACKQNKTVIRVGSNSGSIEKGAAKKYDNPAKALAHSAMENVRILEKYGFYDIVISAKSSSVTDMVSANRILSEITDYPLHLGVTESGSKNSGIIKSSIGIGSLLLDGIGDTIRVSLSGDPMEEAKAAKQILRAIGKDKSYCEIISCPTCARCNYDLSAVVDWLEEYTKDISVPLKIAVMGCAVNGPGEARQADYGIAGGSDSAVIFSKGEVLKKVPFSDIYNEIKSFLSDYIGKE